LLVALAPNGGEVRAIIVAAVGAASLFAWIGALRRWRLARDTPSSKVRSAPQGYVELVGVAAPAGPDLLRDPVTREPCVWFRVETYRDYRKRALVRSAQSQQPFLLRDDTGACAVHPAEAEITTAPPVIVADAEFQHHVWRIRPGERLYVAGHFRTLHHSETDGERHVVLPPRDGRPFLISTGEEAHSGEPYRILASIHLVFFFLGLAALGWLIAR
jgi:hypothetical protein